MGGRFCTVNNGNGFHTIESTEEECYGNYLHTVFLDGELKKDFTLAEVRATAASYDEYMLEEGSTSDNRVRLARSASTPDWRSPLNRTYRGG